MPAKHGTYLERSALVPRGLIMNFPVPRTYQVGYNGTFRHKVPGPSNLYVHGTYRSGSFNAMLHWYVQKASNERAVWTTEVSKKKTARTCAVDQVNTFKFCF